jgi:hypothetical protein
MYNIHANVPPKLYSELVAQSEEQRSVKIKQHTFVFDIKATHTEYGIVSS